MFAAHRRFSQLTTPFIASRCQGIHHMPLILLLRTFKGSETSARPRRGPRLAASTLCLANDMLLEKNWPSTGQLPNSTDTQVRHRGGVPIPPSEDDATAHLRPRARSAALWLGSARWMVGSYTQHGGPLFEGLGAHVKWTRPNNRPVRRVRKAPRNGGRRTRYKAPHSAQALFSANLQRRG